MKQILEECELGRRLTHTETVIINEMIRTVPFNEKMVKRIVVMYNDSLKEHVIKGETVSVGTIGQMSLKLNKYRNVAKDSGLRPNSKKHKYKGHIKWNQAFAQELGRREEEIDSYKNV